VDYSLVRMTDWPVDLEALKLRKKPVRKKKPAKKD
jgi:hypothetical protein